MRYQVWAALIGISAVVVAGPAEAQQQPEPPLRIVSYEPLDASEGLAEAAPDAEPQQGVWRRWWSSTLAAQLVSGSQSQETNDDAVEVGRCYAASGVQQIFTINAQVSVAAYRALPVWAQQSINALVACRQRVQARAREMRREELTERRIAALTAPASPQATAPSGWASLAVGLAMGAAIGAATVPSAPPIYIHQLAPPYQSPSAISAILAARARAPWRPFPATSTYASVPPTYVPQTSAVLAARAPVRRIPWPRTPRFAFGPPQIVSPDGTYLGRLSANRYDWESISNPYGPYGSRFSPTSIMNPFSPYGSRYSPLSVTNPYATSPPLILGR